jgi:hypothetical protein
LGRAWRTLFRRLGDLEETPGFATPPRDGCAFVVEIRRPAP